MTTFKKWISYLYAYSGEGKGNNVGFCRVELRDGVCRLSVGVKGAYGCDAKGLDVGIYIRKQGDPHRISIGTMDVREGCGQFERITDTNDLFGTGISWEEWGGLWIISPEKATKYLASWEKTGLNAGEFLEREATPEQQRKVTEENAVVHGEEVSPELSLWDSLSRYYPRIHPRWRDGDVELLRIRPADIRYLPQNLWYYCSNSFLLHGYYQYKHLILGRMQGTDGIQYMLGVPGHHSSREGYWAGMFGFHEYLPIQEQQGYWYAKIHL